MCNAVMQILLDLLPKDIVRDTLNDQRAKVFDSYADAERMSQRLLLTSNKLMVPIVAFVKGKSDTAMEHK